MKKKLLTIGFLALSLGVFNSQILTYVDNNAKLFVGSGALLYSGGNFQLNSSVDKSVENKGNITIVGDYLKGSTAGTAVDGKEFVNVYTGANDYGQVIILSTTGNTDARMTMQRPAASSAYFNATFPIAFPYKDNVNYLMTSFGKTTADFKGDCAVGVNCGPSIYNMTLRKWNNNLLVNDAVPTASTFNAGDYYLLNLRNADMMAAMVGIIGYKGTPSPGAYSATAKGVINGSTESAFSNLQYNTWKEYVNQYNEKYKTYLGDVNTTSLTYAKNTYRFGNPYTSNLDLSAFDGANAWLYIKNNSGYRTIKEATVASMIKDFYVTKRTSSYSITWNPITGSEDNNTSGSSTYHKAMYDGTQWSGDPQALLIRPLETFNLNFAMINPTNLGGTRILDVEVKFNDNHKTYSYSPSGSLGTTPIPYGRVAASSLRTESTSQKLASNTYNFYQAGIFLVNNDKILGSPTFLVGTNYNTESATTSTNTNNIYAFGIKPDASVAYDSKKDINTFNSNTYVGKPMGIGFNNLVVGNEYELRFNLYEGSIFNEVKDLSTDKFYLLDKEVNKVTEIAADKSYKFTVSNSNYNTRFEVYWKSYSPSGTLGTVAAENNSKSTFVYYDNGSNKVRFEKSGKADLQIYEMGGKLISDFPNVSTNNDFDLILENNKVYIIVVKYSDGIVRTLKTINK